MADVNILVLTALVSLSSSFTSGSEHHIPTNCSETCKRIASIFLKGRGSAQSSLYSRRLNVHEKYWKLFLLTCKDTPVHTQPILPYTRMYSTTHGWTQLLPSNKAHPTCNANKKYHCELFGGNCVRGKCTCKRGYYMEPKRRSCLPISKHERETTTRAPLSGGQKENTVTLYSKCLTNSDCTPINGKCNKGTCMCIAGCQYSYHNKKCIVPREPKKNKGKISTNKKYGGHKKLNTPCQRVKECKSIKGVCKDNKCQCKTYDIFSKQSHICQRKTGKPSGSQGVHKLITKPRSGLGTHQKGSPAIPLQGPIPHSTSSPKRLGRKRSGHKSNSRSSLRKPQPLNRRPGSRPFVVTPSAGPGPQRSGHKSNSRSFLRKPQPLNRRPGSSPSVETPSAGLRPQRQKQKPNHGRFVKKPQPQKRRPISRQSVGTLPAGPGPQKPRSKSGQSQRLTPAKHDQQPQGSRTKLGHSHKKLPAKRGSQIQRPRVNSRQSHYKTSARRDPQPRGPRTNSGQSYKKLPASHQRSRTRPGHPRARTASKPQPGTAGTNSGHSHNNHPAGYESQRKSTRTNSRHSHNNQPRYGSYPQRPETNSGHSQRHSPAGPGQSPPAKTAPQGPERKQHIGAEEYMKACVDDKECQKLTNGKCVNKKCRCSIGYQFEDQLCRSLVECSKFSNDGFQFYNKLSVSVKAREETGAKKTKCRDKCRDRAWCKLATHRMLFSRCHLYDKTWREFPSEKYGRVVKGGAHQRKCELFS